MGGTSFDVALVKEGQPLTTTEGDINRLRISLPMLDVVTIGAGGGSIGWIDEVGLLRMGPQSAGADPGPACYGKGGTEPTLSLIHISEPTRRTPISYAVFCLKKKKKTSKI